MPQIDLDDEDGTLAMLRDSVAAFATTTGGATSLRERRAAGSDLDLAQWRAMADAGWVGLTLPEDLGGVGLGLREQVVLSESIGRALLTEPLAQLGVFSSVLLAASGPGETRDRLARGLADGSRIVSQVWQDTRGRRHPLDASLTGETVTIDGTGHLVAAPRTATDFLVMARTGKELMLVAVDAKTPGFSHSLRPTVDGSMIGSADFEGCTVPTDQILCRNTQVETAFADAIEATRLALASELAGLGARALEITVEFTKERVQFGKPIASFQTIQHRLVDMWSDSEFACAAQANAVETLADNPGLAASLAILAAKARAGDAAVSITRRAIHLHGAMGFTDECDISLYMKRATNLNATLGQSEELRLEFVSRERAA
ncbi:putative acyl-CoA dehydrogenase [Pseudooceanicola batsensis HTCC2597]|uniref:Putative acyl-CoA dehydrogenase n=1 Tax=Pseudooceanicola batsensis (strain ATCC BAA-863 / DSM 15984 / KCTC 12145 / HTCC2597) TaxID=252305 RepID=A3U152_PSEBH|nr:acyl-CoA dehydrogenase family protein [Pseudooceanicola batsensis]EAQ02035.1 putative acyl-CoA dehydrogenase [Pseudooceanicola batsensis HTCC2597]